MLIKRLGVLVRREIKENSRIEVSGRRETGEKKKVYLSLTPHCLVFVERERRNKKERRKRERERRRSGRVHSFGQATLAGATTTGVVSSLG